MPPIIPLYPTRRFDVDVRVVDGEALILDRQGQVIHQLNPTASYIWQRCDGTATVADLAAHLAQVFEVDPPRAARDVAGLVGQLQQLGPLAPDEENQEPAVSGELRVPAGRPRRGRAAVYRRSMPGLRRVLHRA